jgi:hypothetical protein
MNGLEHQEQRMWDTEMNRIKELLKNRSQKRRDDYMEAYTDAIKFLVESDECLEHKSYLEFLTHPLTNSD